MNLADFGMLFIFGCFMTLAILVMFWEYKDARDQRERYKRKRLKKEAKRARKIALQG